jgi:hypothetical protein
MADRGLQAGDVAALRAYYPFHITIVGIGVNLASQK